MKRDVTDLLLAATLAGAGSLGADQTWVNPGAGDWNNGSNWSGGVPNSENVTINNGGTAQIGGPAAPVATIWNNSGSSLQVNGGGTIRVTADLENGGGTLTVNNGGTLNFTGQRITGGNVVVNPGGTLNLGASDDSSWGRIGNGGFGTTTFTVNGGTVNAQYTEGDGLVLGDYEHTTLFTMTSGATLNMGGKSIKVGWWRDGKATAVVDGSAVNFTQDGSLEIGAGDDSVTAVGSLTLQNGATLVKTAADGGGDFLIGSGWGGKANIGSLTVTSGALIDWQRGEFTIGNNGTGTQGTLTLDGGTVTTHSWTPVSRDGAQGHLVINSGTMNVVGDTGGFMQVTTADGGVGVVDINGGLLNVTANGGMIRYQHWGQAGESWGTINLNGGRLIAGDIASSRGSAQGHAVFNFNGGVLQPNGGSVLHDIEAAYVKAGGAIVEFTGNSTTIAQALLDGGGGGGLTVRGNGVLNGGANDENMLILPNYGNTFTGNVEVTGGAHLRLGDGGGNTGDGALGGAANILLDNGGIKNNNASSPVLGAGRTITLGSGGGFFTVGWGDLDLTVQGKVTGVGALNVARDGGNLVLTNPANDYQGDTRIGTNGPGRWTDGYQAGLYLGADEVIPHGPGKGNVVIDGGYGGHLNLNGRSETVNGLSDINGGRIYNSGASATLTVGANDAGGTYHGAIDDGVALRKIGAGTLELAANVNLGRSGETRVEAGVLRIAGQSPGSGAIRMGGGTLALDQAEHVTRQAGLVAGSLGGRWGMDTIAANPGNRGVELTTSVLNDNVNPWGDASEYLYSGAFYVSPAQAGEWTFAENIDDATWLAVDGMVVLNDGSWNNPVRNTVTLTEGWHNIDVRGQNGNGGFGPSNQGWLTNNKGFVYKLGAGTDNEADYSPLADPGDGSFLRTWKNLALPNAVHLDASSTIEVAADGHDWSLTGTIDGGGDLRKTGAGKLTLTAGNTFTGALLVQEGTLALAGTATVAAAPLIDVAQGATFDVSGRTGGLSLAGGQTLSGGGSVAGTVTMLNAVLSPGNSAGILTFHDDLVMAASATLAIELLGAGGGSPVAGVDYDQLVMDGGLLDLSANPNLTIDAPYSSAVGTVFTIVSGGYNGGGFTYNSVVLGDLDELTADGKVFRIDYGAGGGSDILLTQVPEPRVLGLLGLAGALLAGRRRSR